jgi:hypothetical protein
MSHFRIFSTLLIVFCVIQGLLGQSADFKYPDSRPYTRLWWFADTTSNELIVKNLDYLKEKGFGGVECAFIYPYNRKDTAYAPRHEWLSAPFIEKVRFAKEYASELGLGFDFTFGTLWPFGDQSVPRGEATVCLYDSTHTDSMKYLWGHPKPGLVIDHLSKSAFRSYATRLGTAFAPVVKQSGKPSMIFVDSWEVGARYLGTQGFEAAFQEKFGYDLRPFLPNLYQKKGPFPQVLYDYRKLVSEYVLENFYREFHRAAREMGAFSRGQIAGAPCDLIDAYAAVDVPESEALLYEPHYAAIPASAAALSGKPAVSAETFTCLYGFPSEYFKKEQTADLKLLADAIFANGVNQVIWHGKPLARSEKDVFYATVHVGSSGALDKDLLAFNQYLGHISAAMKEGHSYGQVAMYLPTEDAWINGELPIKKQKIWSWGYYEMRENRFPKELMPFRPLWVNGTFLEKGQLIDGQLHIGDCAFKALYVDAKYLDIKVLQTLVILAEKGFPMTLRQQPKMPGKQQTQGPEYARLLRQLFQYKNVRRSWNPQALGLQPLLSGKNLPEYWCRETNRGLTVFMANPLSKTIKFPMRYGQSFSKKNLSQTLRLHYNGHTKILETTFQPYQSILFNISKTGEIQFLPNTFVPPTPVVQTRVKKKYERWEVDPAKYSGKCHE